MAKADRKVFAIDHEDAAIIVEIRDMYEFTTVRFIVEMAAFPRCWEFSTDVYEHSFDDVVKFFEGCPIMFQAEEYQRDVEVLHQRLDGSNGVQE